ncbi:alpha/beta fold hydrolase [Halalkalibaculum sp. DA3122]|uniref:alpha/beta fold hydrolase n=1 Tax=Halalkalibaculum sp. DA3122 TaxID=3373607 RepID=UPI00375490F9
MNKSILSRNNVHVSGEGDQPMIFGNGFGCDQHMWRYIVPGFQQNYRTILFDYVGSGDSDVEAYNSERYSSLGGYSRDLIEIMDAMKLDDIIFVGHSVSCMIGMLAAIQRPERFHRLIMIGPSACYLNDPPDYHGGFDRETIEELLNLMEKNYIGWATTFAPEVMKNRDRPELSEELKENFCSTDPLIAREFAEVTFLSDNRDDLENCTIPTLLIQCADDAIVPVEAGKFIHKKIPDCSFDLLPVSGHCPHLSHPSKTIESIIRYLNSETD